MVLGERDWEGRRERDRGRKRESGREGERDTEAEKATFVVLHISFESLCVVSSFIRLRSGYLVDAVFRSCARAIEGAI